MENRKLNLGANLYESIDFAKAIGFVPVVVQNYRFREVLTLACMNREAWQKTQKTGKAHYYSRSRQRLWLKGEESRHFQEVKGVFIDCDNETILLQFKQLGGGACYLGFRSCFFRKRTGKNLRISA